MTYLYQLLIFLLLLTDLNSQIITDTNETGMTEKKQNEIECLTHITLSEKIQFANSSKGREILSKPDGWAKQLSDFDMKARMRTLRTHGLQEFLNFISANVLDWTPDEQKYWSSLINKLSEAMAGLKLYVPEIYMLKSTGLEEFNAVYTRNRSVVFPVERINFPHDEQRDFFLLAHEIFHILSVENPGLRDSLYALIDFIPLNNFVIPPELEKDRLSNPNGEWYKHVISVQSDTGLVYVTPVIQTTVPVEKVIEFSTEGRPKIFDVLDILLLVVEPLTGEVIRDDKGQPVSYGFSNTDWVRRLQRNTSYIIGPEEIIADNFALLMQWRSTGVMPLEVPGGPAKGFSVNDIELLRKIEKLLSADCDY
jgi:hypothetical protein